MTADIFIKLLDFDTKIKETVTENADGSYTIFINSRLSKEAQSDAYMHALRHILRHDFESNYSADVIEAYAHKLSERTSA